jgi:hypothetical protein
LCVNERLIKGGDYCLVAMVAVDNRMTARVGSVKRGRGGRESLKTRGKVEDGEGDVTVESEATRRTNRGGGRKRSVALAERG